MILRLSKPIPLRLVEPIVNNVLVRSKYKLKGIREDKCYGGLYLPFNNDWLNISENSYIKHIKTQRLLIYKKDKYNTQLLGFNYFENIKCWTSLEIDYLKSFFDDEQLY
jgi:hypothetical protein